MQAPAMYRTASMSSGMYESFYLRAVSPVEPVGVWIRHTVHKPAGREPLGSVWCTVFDAREGAPFMHKLSSSALSVPADGWIAIGQSASMGPNGAHGNCGPARWSLRVTDTQPELRHLTPELLYRAPLPRTKLTSPAPAASFDGVLEIEGRAPIELRAWPGMVGHNWGAQHAERWIWLHGLGFEGEPDAWLDVALGRVLIAGRMTPWLASGTVFLGGRRHRLGGLRARSPKVREAPEECDLQLAGGHGVALSARVRAPKQAAAGWRYADPDGPEHHVVNCSVSALDLDVTLPDGMRRTLRSEHGCAYELGMRETDHGVPLAPFADG